MSARQLLFSQLYVLAILAVLYLVGFALYLHWVLWWYDIVLHVLGGVWVALAISWLFALLDWKKDWGVVIASVIVIGIMWELFEFLIGKPRESNYGLDTSLDLLMDVIGALCGFLYICRSSAHVGTHDSSGVIQ